MSHLPVERLAALADEQPNVEESSHLAQCTECARELDAIRSLVTLAGAERGTPSVPLTRWNTLAATLRSEGLMAESLEPRAESPLRTWFSSRTLLQIAAALLLVAGGVAAGRVSAGTSLLPGGLSGNQANADSVPMTFASTAEAARWQEVYGNGYQAAVQYLTSHDSSRASAASMRTRLSALDRVSRTMREALNDAPADPVINDFYLSSFAQREATLRQLTASLPQGARLNSF